MVILSAVEWITYAYLRWEVYQEEAYTFAENISQFFPLMSIYNLIEQPFVRYAMKVSPEEMPFEHNYAVHWQEILIVLVWTSLFIYGSYALLKKRDL